MTLGDKEKLAREQERAHASRVENAYTQLIIGYAEERGLHPHYDDPDEKRYADPQYLRTATWFYHRQERLGHVPSRPELNKQAQELAQINDPKEMVNEVTNCIRRFQSR